MTKTVGTMARPKLPEDQKRQLHSFRLDPADRKAVQSAADGEGISFPAAAEKYLKAGLMLYKHPAMDEQTADVFSEILDELSNLHSRNNNNRWWKTAKAWAAAKEVFSKGPFARRNPDHWDDDEAVTAAWKLVSEAREEKQEAINMLARMGLSVSLDATPRKQNGLLGLFGTTPAKRSSEQNTIEKIEDLELKATASAIFSMVKKSDEAEAQAMQRWRELIKPYIVAEIDGVGLYREYRRDVVRAELAQGKLPHYEDLL